MPQKTNILIFIHGMVTARSPGDHKQLYRSFADRLFTQRPELKIAFHEQIYVEWGGEPPRSVSRPPLAQMRPDEKLTAAQNTIYGLVNYAAVSHETDPNSKHITDGLYFLPFSFMNWPPPNHSLSQRKRGYKAMTKGI